MRDLRDEAVALNRPGGPYGRPD